MRISAEAQDRLNILNDVLRNWRAPTEILLSEETVKSLVTMGIRWGEESAPTTVTRV